MFGQRSSEEKILVGSFVFDIGVIRSIGGVFAQPKQTAEEIDETQLYIQIKGNRVLMTKRNLNRSSCIC